MATAKKKTPRKRLGLTRFQRKQIRKWRTELGIEMWTINDAMYPLRLKHREQARAWTVAETTRAARLVEILVKKVLSVRKGLTAFVKKKELAVQYRRRLEGAIKGMGIALRYLEQLLPQKVTSARREAERYGEAFELQESFMATYGRGMRALRAAWTQLFYTTQVRDVRRFKLTEDESAEWHESVARTKAGPRDKIREFIGISEGQGVVVHVYDSDNELVAEYKPTWMFTGLAQQAAMKQSKKARQQWNNVYRSKVPATVTEFKQELTTAQQREVTKFLKDHPDERFSLAEVAALTDIEVGELEREAAELIRPHSKYIDNPSEDITLEDVFKDEGLHSAIWKMDFGD